MVLVTAQTQTLARGGKGRSWVSPLGGAWFSLAVPMSQPQAATPMLVGEALLEVLKTYAPGLTLKHPNDILHHGKKLAGILCEQSLTAAENVPKGVPASTRKTGHATSRPATPKTAATKASDKMTPSVPQSETPSVTVIIGVGINANFPAAQLGSNLRTPPTSLRDILGHDIDLQQLIKASAEAILHRLVTI